MNQYLKQMIELADIDNYISSFEPELEQMRSEATKLENELQEKSNDLQQIQEEIAQTQRNISERNVRMVTLKDQQRAQEAKSSEIRKEREANASSMQDQYTKEQMKVINDEIIKLEKDQESKELKLNDRLKELADTQIKISTHENLFGGKLSAINDNRKKVYIEREILVSSMEKKIFALYGKIRRWAKETTAVPVVKGACYGCFMRLSDQAIVEIKQSKDIVTCPNCGRLLYLEDSFQTRKKAI
jgi:predicted  nucleic acid-binding Zn-ribbon protein